MRRRQALSALKLDSRWVGALPLVNHVLSRLHFDELLHKALPRTGRISPARALGVLLRNIVVNDRQPIYTHVEWATGTEPYLIGLAEGEAAHLNDDRVGRALDRLFDADRAALMTELVLGAIREFHIDLDQLHNDSTTVTFSGAYTSADGRRVRGKPTVVVQYGHNKDHRRDLKQLLFVLTVSADGAVPIHYRALNGSTSDSRTHVDSWEMLRKLTGTPAFLYVADCKLCSRAALEHIDKHGGRFITVLPRNRREDKWFRSYIQTHEPAWQEALRRDNPRRRTGPQDVWKVVQAQLPCAEGYRVVWVWNSLMAAQDAEAREARIEKANAAIEALQSKLEGKRCRLKLRERVQEVAEKLLKDSGGEQWVRAEIQERSEPVYRQEKRGRPGPTTRYLRRSRARFSVTARVRKELVSTDARSDGMFPLVTNCWDLPLKAVLQAYKFQPKLEKRHEQLKSVQEVTPVWLKNVSRVEGLLFLYFVALLVQALLERELRRAMASKGIKSLPLYPEERECKAPSAERVFDLFAPLSRHRLRRAGRVVKVFEPQLSRLQSKILSLLRIRREAYESRE